MFIYKNWPINALDHITILWIYLFHLENKNIISNDQEQLLVDGSYCEDPRWIYRSWICGTPLKAFETIIKKIPRELFLNLQCVFEFFTLRQEGGIRTFGSLWWSFSCLPFDYTNENKNVINLIGTTIKMWDMHIITLVSSSPRPFGGT
jgi:hypothetical protein